MKLEDEYDNPDVLPKINWSDMTETMEAIEEYLRSCHGVVRAILAYIIRKPITVQIYDDYPMYTNSDHKMITRILHLPPGKNKLLLEKDAQAIWAHKTEYKIDNRSVYNILDHIYKNTDLIHMPNSISPTGMAEWHIMPFIPDG